MSIPDDVKIAGVAMNEAFGRGHDCESKARSMLEDARHGRLQAYAMVYREPTWLYRGVLLLRDPYADVTWQVVETRPIPRGYWWRNDERERLPLAPDESPDDFDTWDNGTKFVAACCYGHRPLLTSGRLAIPADEAAKNREIREAAKLGDMLNPDLMWRDEHMLGFSVSELRSTGPDALDQANAKYGTPGFETYDACATWLIEQPGYSMAHRSALRRLRERRKQRGD